MATDFLTGFTEWRAADAGFVEWSVKGIRLNEKGELVLDPGGSALETDPYPPSGYEGGNFYTGRKYWVGEATSPVTPVGFGFVELISSWNTNTFPGTWVEIQARVELEQGWTKWYNLGVWASGSETIQRHSVKMQGDMDGTVSVDTLVISKKETAANAFQLKIRLFSVDSISSPWVRCVSAAYSTTPVRKNLPSRGNPALWGTLLEVPACSQMIYPDGGDVWCSPTSVSMVLSFWEEYRGPCEPRIRAAVAGVYDWIFGGHGNWAFNAAYAAGNGMQACIRRYSSLDEIEPWIAKGVPVVFSFSWKLGDLTGAAIPRSTGHLAVIVGFDSLGNPVVNDPAAATDAEVRRIYPRTELENLWLEGSGGTVYIIYPAGLKG